MKPIQKTNFISPGKVYCLCPPKYCLCCQNLTFIQPHSLECAVGGRALYAFPTMVHGVRAAANVQLRVQWAVHYRTGVRSVWLLSSSTIGRPISIRQRRWHRVCPLGIPRRQIEGEVGICWTTDASSSWSGSETRRLVLAQGFAVGTS